MHMPLCSRCHKNVAVVFISKMEEGSTSNEGYCLKCAKELGLPQINDLIAVVFQYHAHDIFADVVHVPVHRRENDGSFVRGGLSRERAAHFLKAELRRLRRADQLGQKERPPLVQLSHLVECGYQVFFHHVEGCERLEKLPRSRRRLRKSLDDTGGKVVFGGLDFG